MSLPTKEQISRAEKEASAGWTLNYNAARIFDITKYEYCQNWIRNVYGPEYADPVYEPVESVTIGQLVNAGESDYDYDDSY